MLERVKARGAQLLAYAIIASALVGVASTHLAVRVTGGSMRPALRPGDIAVVARGRKVNIGDIVLFHSGESQVLHRVERLMPGGRVVTRGDANPVHDVVPATPQAIQGTVVVVLPAGRLIERWH